MTAPPCHPAPIMAEAPHYRPNRAELIDALVQAATALLIAGSDLGISGVARLPLLDQAHRLDAFLGRLLAPNSTGTNKPYGNDRLAGNRKLAARRFRETKAAAAWATAPEA